MAQVQQRLLAFLLAGAAWAAPVPPANTPIDRSPDPVREAPRFYPDDPIAAEPPPRSVDKAARRRLNDIYDYFFNTFAHPGGQHEEAGRPVPSLGVNTLGDVPDSTWFTNRHGKRRLSREALKRGPGNTNPPDRSGPWKVTSAKVEGVTPGFNIVDPKGRRYVMKFGTAEFPELSPAADVISSKAFYAIGYNAPENYIVRFTPEQVVVGENARIVDNTGRERPMRPSDIADVLAFAPRDPDGQIRGLASLYVAGEPLGAFRYHGVRTDDPNDVIPHEQRRDLRGLRVFAAWLNHTDAKSLNSLDTLVEQDGRRFIRHYLIDFGASLGSDSFTKKSPRNGNVYLFDWKSSAAQLFSLGLYSPRWMRADYVADELPAVGNIESEVFDPTRWKSNYFNPAFENMLPDDGYWAAKIVMSFTDDDIRALVETGEFTNPAATNYLAKTLIARRDKIGRAYFTQVATLDGFGVENNRLAFDDLAVRHGFAPARPYAARWFRHDNATGQRHEEATAPSGMDLPPALASLPVGEYIGADLAVEGDPQRRVTVYLRRAGAGWLPVGVQRAW